MDYSIIGFPRIGIHRELKFATEAYFRSEIDADELKRVVSQQRMEQWTRQRDAGAGFIPSNDFSLYDGMLDTAYMPVSYTHLVRCIPFTAEARASFPFSLKSKTACSARSINFRFYSPT